MRVERAIVRQRVGDVKTVLPVMHSDIRTTLNVYGDVVTDETAQAHFEGDRCTFPHSHLIYTASVPIFVAEVESSLCLL